MYALYALVRLSCATLWPCYASFKAVKANDLATIERWLMFWVIMGLVSVGEGTVEWFLAWLPFYWEIKSLAILWLTLPQIEGSTFVYLTWLHPFLLKHESEIDAGLANARASARAAGLGYVRRLAASAREAVVGASAVEGYSVDHPPPVVVAPSTTAPPPSINDPLSGPWSLASTFVRQHGPQAFAAAHALLRPMQGRDTSLLAQMRPERPSASVQTSATSTGLNVPGISNRAVSYSRAEARIRREALERELAELAQYGSGSSPSASSGRSSPDRRASAPLAHSYVGGQPFEEIGREDAPFPPSKPPTTPRGGGWFWSRSPPPARAKAE